MDAHENDLEGLFLVIRKDGSTYGTFQLMETMAHNQWYDYTNDPKITSGSDNVDGGVLFNGSHPMVFCQANGQSPSGGHGVHAYDGTSAPGGDGIIYDPTGTADFPTNTSHSYVYNPYYSHKIVLVNAQSLANRDPFGGGSDMYIKAYVNGNGQTDARFWKKNDAPLNQNYNIVFGANDAEFGANFSESYNTVFVAKPSSTNVEIHVYDSDGTSGNDDMGYVSAVVAPGTSMTWNNAVTSNGQAKVSAYVEAQ